MERIRLDREGLFGSAGHPGVSSFSMLRPLRARGFFFFLCQDFALRWRERRGRECSREALLYAAADAAQSRADAWLAAAGAGG